MVLNAPSGSLGDRWFRWRVFPYSGPLGSGLAFGQVVDQDCCCERCGCLLLRATSLLPLTSINIGSCHAVVQVKGNSGVILKTRNHGNDHY